MDFYDSEMVLFDLDGTLADTAPDLACCINMMLAKLGMPEQTEDKIKTWIGNGIEYLVKRALSDASNKQTEATFYRKALSSFTEFYTENNCVHSKLFPGVIEALTHLKSGQYKIGCVTNKRSQFTERLLQALGIHSYFDIIISGDTLPKKKPDPMPLLHAAEYFSVAPAKALMVGDSCNDVNAARAAGFPILCVSYGYNFGKDIRESQPDIVVDTLSTLPHLL